MAKHQVASLVACLALCGCGMFGPRAEVRIVVPEPPEAWVRAFPDLGFRLAWPDSAGQWQSLTVSGALRTASISCSKAGNTPVLAYPVSGRSAEFLRPAGGLFPADLEDAGLDSQHLALSWRGGCLASVFAKLTERGMDTSLVNSARLGFFLDRHPDPWALDLDKIAEKLILGGFSAYDIDLLPARDVTVRPGAGEWFSESPFEPVLSVSEGQPITLTGLSIGMHALFSVQGGRIRVWVGEGETVIGP